MLKSAIYISTSLLLEFLGIVGIATLKVFKNLWYLAKWPFLNVAKVLDRVTNFFNAPISAAIDKLVMLIKHKYGNLSAILFSFSAYIALEVLSILIVNTLISGIEFGLFSIALPLPILFIVSFSSLAALILSSISIVAIANANFTLSTYTIPSFKTKFELINDRVGRDKEIWSWSSSRIININREKLYLINGDIIKESHAKPLESSLSFIFRGFEFVSMLPVKILNMPVTFIQQYLNTSYTNKTETPWHVLRAQERLAQLQTEIYGEPKAKHATITKFSSKDEQISPVLPSSELKQPRELTSSSILIFTYSRETPVYRGEQNTHIAQPQLPSGTKLSM